MEKFQEPIPHCHLFGEQQLEVGRWEDGNAAAVYLTDYGSPFFHSQEEQTAAAAAALTFQPQQQQPFFTYDHLKQEEDKTEVIPPQYCAGGGYYSSSSTILPCLEDYSDNKMPFLQMLQSSGFGCNPQPQIFYHDNHQGFRQLLLELQEQQQEINNRKKQHHISPPPPPPQVLNHQYYYQTCDYPALTPKSNLYHELVESCVTDEIMMELYSSTSPAKSVTTTANKEVGVISDVINPPPRENILSCNNLEQKKGKDRRTTSSQRQIGKPPLVTKERKKRKRTRPSKNKEEMESQRMTHIAVERNRRRQMNDHLNSLRSLMPSSYIQRGDQASIIGGAIDFVKKLEQLLQSLQAQKRMRLQPMNNISNGGGGDFSISSSSSSTTSASPPSSSTDNTQLKSTPCTRAANKDDDDEHDDDGSCRDDVKEEGTTTTTTIVDHNNNNARRLRCNSMDTSGGRMEGDDDDSEVMVTENSRSPGADVSVVVIHNHVNLKIQCRRRTGQLVKAILALEDVRLTVLHLNVTPFSQTFVHYSFNLKVEDDCELRSAEEIASAVHQIFNGFHLS